MSFFDLWLLITSVVNRYGTSVSQMTTAMFHLSQKLSDPFPIQDLSPGL